MEYTRFYIVRTKMRADGDIDFEKAEAYTEAKARYQYNTWIAGAYVDTTYPQIAVALLDCRMVPMEHECIPTSYVAPDETATAETAETQFAE